MRAARLCRNTHVPVLYRSCKVARSGPGPLLDLLLGEAKQMPDLPVRDRVSGRKPGYSGFRWIASSLLLMISFMVFSQIAHMRNWPSRELLVVDTVGLLVFVPVVAGVWMGYRTRAKHSQVQRWRTS